MNRDLPERALAGGVLLTIHRLSQGGADRVAMLRANGFAAAGLPTAVAVLRGGGEGERAMLEKDGSYPSGHSAIGMAWSLLLTEISPAQTDAILARGRSFALSRMVCNAHWHSDTIQGRYVGAYTVARLPGAIMKTQGGVDAVKS